MGGSFNGRVFVGEGNFLWERELDFPALMKKFSQIESKKEICFA